MTEKPNCPPPPANNQKPGGPKIYTLGEIIAPGKPTLLTMASDNAAVAAAKEEAWKRGKEPILMDCEFTPADVLESEVKATQPDSFIILTETRHAPADVIAKIPDIIRDPERTIVVTRNADAKNIDPKVFTDAGGHSVKL